jgi:hypothetical protein
MEIIKANDDDLKLLFAKRFVIGFQSGIIVIKHWKINNLIRSDRYHETKYLDEKNSLESKENGAYTEIDNQMATRLTRLTEVSIGKVSIVKDNIKYAFMCKYFDITEEEDIVYKQAYPKVDTISEYYKMIAWLIANPKKQKKDYPRFINNWLNKANDKITMINNKTAKELMDEQFHA